SYTTSSPSDYAYSNHYNYTQHPSYHTPFLPQQPNQTPNSNYLQHITTFHDQQISSKPAEISGKYKKEWEEYQRVFAEKLQAIRLAHKENLQKVSDKYTALKQSRQERLVDTNQEKVEEEEPPEKDGEFIASVEEKEPIVIEEAEKFVTGGSDICFVTDLNLEIIEKENKEEKEQELTQFPPPCPKLPPPQFLSTVSSPALLSPPQGPVPLVEPPSKQLLKSLETNISPASKPPSKLPEPSDQKFPSETFSVPPPAIRPPLKPPDPSPSFLISQSHLRTPLCFSKSPLINSLPRPPENVSSLTLAPPPSLKPPFTNQTLSQPPNSSPSLLRPPAKPPDLKSGVELQLIMPMVKHKYCLLSFLHRDTQRVFALSDQQGASTNESQPCIQITIRLQPSPPTASCHVSNCL
ncbi:hypothetical protein L195_g048235, partial [Trifolium pratense]